MNKDTFLSTVKSFVIKWGTQVLFDETKQEMRPELSKMIQELSALWLQEKRFVLVSSGAVALGLKHVKDKIENKELSTAEKQACAAIGQKSMMSFYEAEFAKNGVKVAQVLLTSDDFRRRQQFLNLRNVIEQLLKWDILPIVNENDSVSTFELEELNFSKKSFGDNDLLSALLASKLNADLLVIFSNIQGIFSAPPENPEATLIEEIVDINSFSMTSDQLSVSGRGGIKTKLEAARLASISGIPTVVCSGLEEGQLENLFNNPELLKGTFVHAQDSKKSKKKWIGVSSGYEGIVVVNEGAKIALLNKNASLLPVGIDSVQGVFTSGDVVSIHDENSNEIGRGKILVDSDFLKKILKKSSQEIKNELSVEVKEVINRDHLLVYK